MFSSTSAAASGLRAGPWEAAALDDTDLATSGRNLDGRVFGPVARNARRFAWQPAPVLRFAESRIRIQAGQMNNTSALSHVIHGSCIAHSLD